MKQSTDDRILERLPSFYKTWTDDSVIAKFVKGFAKTLNETEKDLFRIMRGHWVDSAKDGDLDRLGSIYNIHRPLGESDLSFRRRVKRAIQEYKGGGTRAAIEFALKALFGPLWKNIELIEFPPTPVSIQVEVSSGDTWKTASLGIRDAVPVITLSTETKGAEIRDPRVTSLVTGESVGIVGLLSAGQELSLGQGKTTINGVAVEGEQDHRVVPRVLRKGSEWQYKEFLHGKLGTFDSGTFDNSFFATPLPKVRIRFDWTTEKSCTVEVRVPRVIMEKVGLREEEIMSTLNAIKATGVEVRLDIPSLPTPVTPLSPAQPAPTLVPRPRVPLEVTERVA